MVRFLAQHLVSWAPPVGSYKPPSFSSLIYEWSCCHSVSFILVSPSFFHLSSVLTPKSWRRIWQNDEKSRTTFLRPIKSTEPWCADNPPQHHHQHTNTQASGSSSALNQRKEIKMAGEKYSPYSTLACVIWKYKLSQLAVFNYWCSLITRGKLIHVSWCRRGTGGKNGPLKRVKENSRSSCVLRECFHPRGWGIAGKAGETGKVWTTLVMDRQNISLSQLWIWPMSWVLQKCFLCLSGNKFCFKANKCEIACCQVVLLKWFILAIFFPILDSDSLSIKYSTETLSWHKHSSMVA